MSKVVELIGGSGCGKTFLLTSDLLPIQYDFIFIAGENLTLEDYKSRSKTKFFFLKCMFSRKVLLSKKFLCHIIKSRIFNLRLVANLGYKVALSEFLALYNGGEVILIEEGPTQAKYNFFKINNSILLSLNMQKFNRHVMLVKCDKETQLKRLGARGHWRVPESDMLEFVTFNQCITEDLMKELSECERVCSLKLLENSLR